MSNRLSTKIEAWVEEAIDANALGDDITWDMTFAMVPNEGPRMLAAFFLPGAVLGTVIQSVVILENLAHVTQGDITPVVAEAIENMRQGRSEQLTESESSAAPA